MIFVMIMFLLPVIVILAAKKIELFAKIGPVIVCYGCGFLLSSLPGLNKGLLQTVASISVALAIPLILMSFDVRQTRNLTRPIMKGLLLMVLSVVVVCTIGALLGERFGLNYGNQMAGMCIGLYTGGTPNLIAIGNAILPREVSAEIIAAANTADSIVGGIYILLAFTVIPKLYRRKKTVSEAAKQEDGSERIWEAQYEYQFERIPHRMGREVFRYLLSVLLAVGLFGIGCGLEFIINRNLDSSLWIMLAVSIGGVAISFIRPIREIPGTYQSGQYLVLVFSLGLGMSIDLKALLGQLLPVIAFFTCMQMGSLLLHFLLCRLFSVDGGAAFITGIAGIYGPPFIAPAANAYGDSTLIIPGVICAVAGLAIGNLLGICAGSLFELLI